MPDIPLKKEREYKVVYVKIIEPGLDELCAKKHPERVLLRQTIFRMHWWPDEGLLTGGRGTFRISDKKWVAWTPEHDCRFRFLNEKELEDVKRCTNNFEATHEMQQMYS